MNDKILKHKSINFNKLLHYGFARCGKKYTYTTAILDKDFTLTVEIFTDSEIKTSLVDNMTGDLYTLHLTDAVGEFIGNVRNAYEEVLQDIADKCFEREVFKQPQSKRIIDYIYQKYGDSLEYLWEKFDDNAIWRRKDNAKWYGALLTVSAEKLIGRIGKQKIEVLDIRANENDVPNLIDNRAIYPGYHMNKKHWITIPLDDSASDEMITALIDESYLLAKKK